MTCYKNARRKCSAFALASMVFAIALVMGAAPDLQAQTLDAYRLGPGDRLKITVFDHPKESGEFEVDSLGNVAYPLIGRIAARGQTVAEFQASLRKTLDEKFIVNPKVSIEVLTYRPFYIYGEVNRGGSYPYVVGLTVRRAVAIAGGFTRRAREVPVLLVRDIKKGVTKLDRRLDETVLPGDIIEVQRRLF
jgi:polysaccharide export outer membrane protein